MPAKKTPKEEIVEVKPPLFTEMDMAAKIIKDYPNLAYKEDHTGKVSSWVVFTNDYQKFEDHHRQVCHMGVRNEEPGYDQLITAAPYHSIGWRYYQWLSDGPFRAFSDKISLSFLESGNVDTAYLRLTELGVWPANILYNFVIAARAPIEHQYMINRWTKFVDVGMDKSLAWLVASKIGPNQIVQEPIEPELKAGDVEGLWSFKPPLHHNWNRHDWLCTTSDWNRVINGDFDMSKVTHHSYKDNPIMCTPCDVIWGCISGEEFEPMMDKTMEELHEYFKLGVNKFDPNAPKPKPKPKVGKYMLQVQEMIAAQQQAAQLDQNVVNAIMAAAPGAGEPVWNNHPGPVGQLLGALPPDGPQHWNIQPVVVNFANINFGQPAADPVEQPDVQFMPDEPMMDEDDFEDDFHFDDDEEIDGNEEG